MTAVPDTALAGVWRDLVGQGSAIERLRRAVADDRSGDGHAMTHAWLFTGPPGSGRSNAAVAFAAALECPWGGCGECGECKTAVAGTHPDVTLVDTEQLSIGVDEIRELVRRASMSPTVGRRQVIIITDADRVTDRGVGALLKAIEEPAPRTVWMLCAPTPADVIVTIRSRCRSVVLVTPDVGDVARLLSARDGIDESLAWHSARIAQGHIGRAKRLATDEQSRQARRQVLQIPGQLTDLPACLGAAASVVALADEQAARISAELDAKESAELSNTLSTSARAAKTRTAQAALKDLEEQQKMRAKRVVRDELDRVITELTTYYRDVLTLQLGGAGPDDDRVINSDMMAELAERAHRSTPEHTMACVDGLLEARIALQSSVAPLLAMEALMIALAPDVSG